MKKSAFLLTLATSLTVGCASNPDKLQTSYVSPMVYQHYECDQVIAETDRVNRRANELHGNLKTKANNDTAQMAVGMVLFWPALLFLEGGDGPDAQEYSRLKGEREALEKIAVEKRCNRVAMTEPSAASNQQGQVTN